MSFTDFGDDVNNPDGDGDGATAESPTQDGGSGLPGYPIAGYPDWRGGVPGSGGGLLGMVKLADPGKQPTSPSANQSGVPGFPHTWDPIVQKDVAAYNQMNNAQPGDDVYLDPDLVKAMIMTESAHDLHAYNTDPMQVNKRGDWDGYKGDLGLVKGQAPGPELSIKAGLGWLDSKSYIENAQGQPGPFLGYGAAVKRYNGHGNPNYYNDVMANYKLIKNNEK